MINIKTKDIIEKKAKILKYTNEIINNFCEVYNYEYINLIETPQDNIEKLIENYKDQTLPKKIYFNDSRNMQFGINIIGSTSDSAKIDIISFAYRLLEELGIEDLMVNINTDNKALLENLMVLDIDYETNANSDILSFEIADVANSDSNIVLAHGKVTKNNETISCIFDTDALIELLNDLEINIINNKDIEVYITSETEEEKIKSLEIAQNLRLSGIITEINLLDRSLDEQLKDTNCLKAKFLIILNKEELSKGLITIKDNLLNEEIKIDENEILDYLLSNI